MNITFPVIELLDRLIIAKIKLDKTNANHDEYAYYQTQAEQFDLAPVQNLLDELEHIHRTIWSLESELKSGVEDQLSLEEIGRRAIAIRNQNNLRIKIKNQLAEQLNCTVREIKQDHLST
jgi:hypothetical protein